MMRSRSQPELNQNAHAPRTAAPITAYQPPETARYDPPVTQGNHAPSFINTNIPTQNYNHRPQFQFPQTAKSRDVNDFAPSMVGGQNDGIPDTVIRDSDNQDVNTYDPKVGLGIHFDFITSLDRKHRDVRLVYGVFNYSKVVVSNREVGVMQSEPDPANMTRNRVFFDKKHILKGIKPHAGSNLIMEFQVRRHDTESDDVRYASIGWTIMNLFDSNYELNSGQFRCPLYQTPTQPDLDVRDISKLAKLDKVMFCFRIAVPKDPLAKTKVLPDTHPGHYSIPRIHSEVIGQEAKLGNNDEIAKIQDNDKANIQNQIEEQKAVQESYEWSGINIFIHYTKNFEPTSLIRIRWTLFEGPKLLRDSEGKAWQWSSRVVHPEEAIIANQDNMEKLTSLGVYIYNQSKFGNKDIIVPINDDKSFLRDFYTMLLDNHLKNDIFLLVELMIKENPYKGGTYRNLSVADPDSELKEYTSKASTIIKWSNFDGTLRYGSYEVPFYESPLDRNNPKNNKELPYIIRVTVGQPVNLPENVPNDLFNSKKRPESLFKKPDDFVDNSDFPQRNPNSDNPDPFIQNEKNQVKNELFKSDDSLIFYVDAARFLPENVSFTRCVVNFYTSNGYEVIEKHVVNANFTKSTGQNPHYGFRIEVNKTKNPNLDPTMIGVFRIETFDRSNLEQRVVGFGLFPFFLDKNMKSPITKPGEKKFVLYNGWYQIPLYSEKPEMKSPILIENLTKLEKLPCSTLLIRIDKLPRDGDGKPLDVNKLSDSEKYELGVISFPPKYSQGVYNTLYWYVGLTEAEILKEKVMRPDPNIMKVASTTKEMLGEKTKMSIPELKVFVENAFNENTSFKDLKMLNYNFFSQYIPRIGLRVAVEMVFNTDPNKLYIAILSVNPPASLYQKVKKFEKSIFITDIDFESPWSAQRFNETLYTFKNMPSDPKTTFIIDIKWVSFLAKGVSHVEDYGWGIIPMFEDLETDDDPDTLELYVNTGVFMVPLFEGQVVGDFVNTIAKQQKPYTYLMNQLNSEIPPIRLKDSAGVIFKIVDNQREGHFKEPIDHERVEYKFLPKDLIKSYTFDQSAINALKRAPNVSKLLPKGKKAKEMKDELMNILKAEYNFE